METKIKHGVPNISKLQPWAKWYAQDSDGDWYQYEEKPTADTGEMAMLCYGGCWIERSGHGQLTCFDKGEPNPDWQNTLTEVCKSGPTLTPCQELDLTPGDQMKVKAVSQPGSDPGCMATTFFAPGTILTLVHDDTGPRCLWEGVDVHTNQMSYFIYLHDLEPVSVQ